MPRCSKKRALFRISMSLSLSSSDMPLSVAILLILLTHQPDAHAGDPSAGQTGTPKAKQNLRSRSGTGKLLGRLRSRRAGVPVGVSALPPAVPPGAGWRHLCRTDADWLVRR